MPGGTRMTPELTRIAVLLVAAAGVGVAAAFGCRWLAFRVGAVCQPRRDRWSAKPVPLLGGLAIFAGTACVLPFVPGLPTSIWVLLAGAAALGLVGLVDDLR